MDVYATLEEKIGIERSVKWEERDLPVTLYGSIARTARLYGERNAISFQLLSDPDSRSETLTWSELLEKVTQAANLFRSLGIERNDTVALLMPNCTETVVAQLGAMVAGIANPINPLLDSDQIAGILRASNARLLVTLKAFPKSSISELAAKSVALVPDVEHVLEVDLKRHLSPPKSWIVPFVRPRKSVAHAARVSDFNGMLGGARSDGLEFDDVDEDRVAALFHTGGTTGVPKLARHRYSGMLFNGWAGSTIGLNFKETLICPLPLFHVFAAYPAVMSAVATGCHVVFPTPAGYRGEGVFQNFWRLVERWKATYMLTVPTALAALMQNELNADVSCLKAAISGSAPLPGGLFARFEESTGVRILEGYGLTEATCLVSVNPLRGTRKVGSVGIPVPYVDVRILKFGDGGEVTGELGSGETGEICISCPGVIPGGTYVDSERNRNLFADEKWLRTGDLGYLDDDGYLWITGRAKDLIIRGGQNIDPVWIEEVMSRHPAVALAAAIGQPDDRLGEVPCMYVELIQGADAESSDLARFAETEIRNSLARPVHLEILPELPRTSVGKVFKPSLRKLAIKRVLSERLEQAGLIGG